MLSNVFSNLKNTLFTKRTLIVLLSAIVLVGVSYYFYNNYVLPRIQPSFVQNNEFVKDDKNSEAEIMLFYVDWCPHCKTAKPIWEEVKEKYNGKNINNTTLYFKEVDCEKNEDLADKYNINGYPTIKLVKENEIVNFDAKPSEKTLTQFIHSTL
jgi:thiol-disulfide isomerase/thioredoxin